MDFQLAAFEHASVLIAKNRQQHFVVQLGFKWAPVDVEIFRVGGAWAIFENIHPPDVERLADPHVVRDKIQDLSHSVGVQFRSEEHTSELQSRFGISYAVFCLKKK